MAKNRKNRPARETAPAVETAVVETAPAETAPAETAPAETAKRKIGVLRQLYNRQQAFPGTAVITGIPGKNGQNPKKAGSKAAVRFAAYQVGQTVDEYVAAVVALGQPGCTSLNARADVRWDWVHGFVQIDNEVFGQ